MNKYQRITSVVGLLAVTLLSGCASIMDGRDQEMTFRSVPEGASVLINGREIGKTPYIGKIDRKKDQILTFQKDGYKSENLSLTTNTNGWFIGNVIFGVSGLFSSTTDASNGSMYQYSPSFYQVTLSPLTASDQQALSYRLNESRSFIVTNYARLAAELKALTDPIGTTEVSHPNLDALHSLLRVPKGLQEGANERLRLLMKQYIDISDFAKNASEQLIVK
ncbi:MAG: PEGA domain-containing protein [Trichlorobacter sp.]